METLYEILNFDLNFLLICFIIIVFICTSCHSIVLLNLRAVIASILFVLFGLHAILAVILEKGLSDILFDILLGFLFLILTISNFKLSKKITK